MVRLAVVLLVLFAFAGCASDTGRPRVEAGCRLVRLAQVPLEARGDMLFVHGQIDDQPIKLLVDTGAERTLLTESAVDRLHLPRDFQHATRTFGIGSPTATWDAKLRNGIELGGTEFPVDRVTVGRFAINEAAGSHADGLLGADVLLAFDIDLNLPAHEMTLYQPRHGCLDAPPPWRGAYISVDGVSTRQDRLLLPFALDGVHGTAILESGAQMSSISQQMAERVGLQEADFVNDRTVMAHGAAPDQIPVRIHRFTTFRVGPAEMHGPAMPVVPMSSGMGDALIGGDFLRGRRLWVSFSTHQLFLAPLEHGPWLAVTRTDETPASSRPPDNFLQENSATVPTDVAEDPHRR
jgi:predicted aspartyl protease